MGNKPTITLKKRRQIIAPEEPPAKQEPKKKGAPGPKNKKKNSKPGPPPAPLPTPIGKKGSFLLEKLKEKFGKRPRFQISALACIKLIPVEMWSASLSGRSKQELRVKWFDVNIKRFQEHGILEVETPGVVGCPTMYRWVKKEKDNGQKP